MDRTSRLAHLFPELLDGLGRLRSLVHDGLDLTYNQYKTLLTIAAHDNCSLGRLAGELDIAMSSTSQMVERLVGQGLVDRTTDRDNRRQVIIRLTPAGAQLIAALQGELVNGYRRALAQLNEDDQEALISAFETIAAILKGLAAKREEEPCAK